MIASQTSLFSLLDDPAFLSVAAAPAALLLPRPARVVYGWIKTYQGPTLPAGSESQMPTLNQIPGDGMLYRQTRFMLTDSVSVGEYPGGFGQRGIRVKGAKDLISLYDAVKLKLVQEANL